MKSSYIPTRLIRALDAGPLGRSGLLLAATIALSLLTIWIVFVAIAYETYQTEWKSASDYSQNVATLIERDISRTIELYDLSLQAVSEDAKNPAVMALPTDLRRRTLYDNSANASGLGTIVVLDRHGKVTEDSRNIAPAGLDLSDRDFFIAQRDGRPVKQPFVSHVFKSRVSGRSMIGFSRPLRTADGVFDGAVVGSISSDFLTLLFRSVKLPPDSAILLVHDDGTTLSRVPLHESDLGRRLVSPEIAFAKTQNGGEYTKTSSFDGVERLFSVRQVGTLPIYLTVGLSTQQLLAHWFWRAEVMGIALILLSALILLLGWTLARELKRRAQAELTLSELASTDSLTQLANRRKFDQTIDLEWRRAIRESTSIALLMIDGDFFKAFNDTYGHLEGDHALKTLADTLQTCVERPGDLVARFGGEEFVVLLPNTEHHGAETIALAIRHAIGDVALPHAASPFGQLTVSIGVAVRRPIAHEPSSNLIEAADAALYTAKAEGRDRIVVDGSRPMRRVAKQAIGA